ncbi:hypothetical protein F7725_021369 [Dissostichus mawsoni]|uniref:Endonuclease/exonuclease/phosphatase domain-containing protein n=1 Tax=Dissostichus mawsoni TaxID=36200 RepID=A0A7J5ZBM2_DISMA|nr:hypothetical protein F7725_021369 [Dissostichus mawsoni]
MAVECGHSVTPASFVWTVCPATGDVRMMKKCSWNQFTLSKLNKLTAKIDQIKVLVHSSNPEVLVITESWLKKNIPDSDIGIAGYNVFRQDRSSKAGGVVIFTKEHLQCSIATSKSVPKQFDLLIVNIKLANSSTLTVAGCYRPPSAPACTLPALSTLLAPHTHYEFVLLGDLNWDMLNPPAQVQKQWDSLNLSQIILTPTRYDTKNPEKATLLDVILTNNPDRYKTGVFCSDLSDHCLIGCIRNGGTIKVLTTHRRILKHFDEQAFLYDLAAIKWTELMENKPPSSHLPDSLVIEDTVVTGNERIAELFNQHFVKSPPKPPTNTPPPSPSSAAPCHSFCLQEVSENDVLEVLSKLDPNKPAGLDGLDPFFFKVAAPIIAEAISHLCNLSIQTAVLPSAWKAASVQPLFKGGNHADPNCYRPISILPCIAKVLEKRSSPSVPSAMRLGALVIAGRRREYKKRKCRNSCLVNSSVVAGARRGQNE